MSVPSADLAAKPVTLGGGAILWIAFGLMALAGLTAFLVLAKSGPIDGAAALEAAFGAHALPRDFRIVEATVMPGGQKLIVLENTAAGPEPLPSKPPETAAKPAKIDWRAITPGASGTPPRRLTVLLLPPGAAHSQVELFFQQVNWRELSELPPEGGVVGLGSGKTAWHGFDAAWVHERSFEPGGTFRDAVRVDVSVEDQLGVLTAFWTRGEQGSKAALDPVLAAFGSN